MEGLSKPRATFIPIYIHIFSCHNAYSYRGVKLITFRGKIHVRLQSRSRTKKGPNPSSICQSKKLVDPGICLTKSITPLPRRENVGAGTGVTRRRTTDSTESVIFLSLAGWKASHFFLRQWVGKHLSHQTKINLWCLWIYSRENALK